MHRLAAGSRFALLLVACSVTYAADSLPGGLKPEDIRLKPQRQLGDKYHPWSPPESKEAWEKEADRIRRQILVSNGLWPLPEKTPLEPVIYGLNDRGDYTVEKVFFRSRPGVYVTGSLYRPKNEAPGGKRPGILCPHGHWPNGRFYDAGEKAAVESMKTGAETFFSGAHSPLQARMIQLARMGCTVFFYDMVGIADNSALPHQAGFNDVAAELWLQNKMGLQTWNSIRAVDFIESLPDVDPKRIGVTGASGGGTQTFMLFAVDPRPAVAFPAVMVGTAMQGGCTCENASYMRQDINNVAIAALAAPRPLGMTGANDWTIDIETKGLPELKKVYGLYGKADNVEAKCFPHFPHNYNEVSREVMNTFMAKHLGLGSASVEQTDFWPMTREQLTVFDDKHPKPEDWLNANDLRAVMKKDSEAMMAGLALSDEASLKRYREVIGGAANVMFGAAVQPDSAKAISDDSDPRVHRSWVEFDGHRIPMIQLKPTGKANNEVVVWIDGKGKSHLFGDGGKPKPAVQKLLDAGYTVASADVVLTGDTVEEGKPAAYPVNKGFPGYTYCYNRPLLALRVRDIVATRNLASHIFRKDGKAGTVHLVGTGDAGLWVLLSHLLPMSPSDARTIVDLNGFQFQQVDSVEHPNLLPGALKYGDVDGLAALAAPATLTIHRPSGSLPLLSKAIAITKGRMQTSQDELSDNAVVEQILKAR
jgi:hypothetical protein